MKKLSLIILIITLIPCIVNSQETNFSQFYTSASYLNPSLAGIDEESKFTLNYRNHWPQIPNSFVTQNASFETNLSRLNNGLAINVYKDEAGDGLLTVSSYSGVYAHEFRLRRNLYLRSGVKASFVHKNVRWDKLVFEDMIDPQQGNVLNTQQKVGRPISFLDLSGGIYLYNNIYYGGLSIDHLTETKAGLISENGYSKLQRKYTLHGGAKFNMSSTPNYSISPNILISHQATFTTINMGLYLEASSLLFGMWYHSQNSVTLMLGVKKDRFQVGYSYDIYSSNIVGSNASSHEISYVQTFKSKKRKKKNYRTTPCPKF